MPANVVPLLLLTFAAVSLTGQVPALDPDPLDLLQDKKGFVWAATSQGLQRYDAHGSRMFRVADGLPNDYVSSIAETSDGTIWAGTYGGLAYVDRDRLVKVWDGMIQDVNAGSRGRVYFSDYREKRLIVGQLDGGRWVFRKFPQVEVISSVVENAESDLWFATLNSLSTLVRGDLERGLAGDAEQIRARVGLRGAMLAPRLQEDDKHRILYSTQIFISVFDPQTAKSTLLSFENEARMGRLAGSGGRFSRDAAGRVWIPHEFGIAEWSNERVRPMLASAKTMSMLIDREGTLWSRWQKLSELDGWMPESGPSPPESIWTVSRSQTGDLFAVAFRSAFRWNPRARNWVRLPLAASLIETKTMFSSILPLGADLVIPGVGRIYRLSKEGRLLGDYPVASPAEIPLRWYILRKASENSFWAGANYGLYRGSFENGRFLCERLALPGDGRSARTLSVALNGDLAVGYAGGAAIVRNRRVIRHFNKASGLREDRIQAIGTGGDNEIWVGYDNERAFSRIRWNETGQPEIRHFDGPGGYKAPGTVFFHRDRRGWIWRGGVDGYFVCDGKRVEPEDWVELNVERFPEAGVMQSGVFEDVDGTMWFGTNKGVLHYKPPADLFERSRRPTPVAITSVSWDNQKPIDFGQAAVRVDGGVHSLSVKFAALSFVQPKEIRYKYRLWPYEKEWKATQEHEIRYANLPAGSYRFEVLAKGFNLAWTDQPATYAFELIGPWYSSIWFLSGSSLAGAGFLVLAQRRWAARHARTVAAKAELAEVKELFLQVIDLDEQERRSVLQQRDATLAAKVEQMLKGRGELLDEPVWRVMQPDPRKDLDGVILGDRYEVSRWLASGGFANVYLAKDLKLGGRLTAVKVPHAQPEDPAWVEKRLRQEIEALGRIRHPNVVTVVDIGQVPDGRTFVAMEYVDGATLREVLGHGALPMKRVRRLMRQFGKGIAAAHAQGVVHRDLKPENLMLREAGRDDEQLVIIDFGIALVKSTSDPTTGLSRPAGSLDYMAPELLVGSASAASDVYAMGLILYEMLTGERASAVRQRSGDFANELLSKNPRVPVAVAAMVGEVLRYQPEERRWTAADFAATVAEAVERIRPPSMD